MRHSTKMLLIPYELYSSLMENTLSSASTDKGHNNAQLIMSSDTLGQSRQKIKGVAKNRKLNADAKLIRYNQEYKRYRKFYKDIEDKPVNVSMAISNNNNNNSNVGNPPIAPKFETGRMNSELIKTDGGLFNDNVDFKYGKLFGNENDSNKYGDNERKPSAIPFSSSSLAARKNANAKNGPKQQQRILNERSIKSTYYRPARRTIGGNSAQTPFSTKNLSGNGFKPQLWKR